MSWLFDNERWYWMPLAIFCGGKKEKKKKELSYQEQKALAKKRLRKQIKKYG